MTLCQTRYIDDVSVVWFWNKLFISDGRINYIKARVQADMLCPRPTGLLPLNQNILPAMLL